MWQYIQLKGVFVFSLLLLLVCCAKAQVEHNYLVGPQNTDCDSLDLSKANEAEAMDLIRKTKFRFDQHFDIRRNTGLQAGHFFSCDNKTGYLIIKSDGQNHLFVQVPMEIWEMMTSGGDPEGIFQEKIKSKYPFVQVGK